MNTAQVDEAPTTRKRVRGYLGEYLIAEYSAEAGLADRYTEAMQKNFGGLEWKVDDVPAGEAPARPVPAERLWELAP